MYLSNATETIYLAVAQLFCYLFIRFAFEIEVRFSIEVNGMGDIDLQK